MIHVIVLLGAKDADALQAFERQAVEIMKKYEGKLVAAFEPYASESSSSNIAEVHYLQFPTIFMLSYNGVSRNEMLLSKAAAFAALGVAMFPCGCGSHEEVIPHIHYISAAIMFSILAYFCHLFRKRATGKGYTEAMRRAKIYVICGSIIVLSMLTML